MSQCLWHARRFSAAELYIHNILYVYDYFSGFIRIYTAIYRSMMDNYYAAQFITVQRLPLCTMLKLMAEISSFLTQIFHI